MKTRFGFVSNSSTSSFIIAVPNKAKECECCHQSDKTFLEMLCKYLTTLTPQTHQMYSMTNAETVKEYYESELKDLRKTKPHVKEQLAIIEELEADPKLWENYQRLMKQLEWVRYNALTKEPEAKKWNQRDSLVERKQRLLKHQEDFDKNVAEIKRIIQEIEKAIAEDYSVYSFTLDNWTTDVEAKIKEMIYEGRIRVIHRVNT